MDHGGALDGASPGPHLHRGGHDTKLKWRLFDLSHNILRKIRVRTRNTLL
uniref:Uncharacterized protein n=1 Tax=Setaria italica TaxID=4555 RepID=K3XSK7_SETIT